jgi:hypothetical protein
MRKYTYSIRRPHHIQVLGARYANRKIAKHRRQIAEIRQRSATEIDVYLDDGSRLCTAAKVHRHAATPPCLRGGARGCKLLHPFPHREGAGG